MAIVAPVLNGVTMPHASEFSEVLTHRGGAIILANGGISFDVVAATKKTFTLGWRGLLPDDKAKIITAFNSMATASVSFTPPEGAATNVTRSDQQPDLNFVATASAGRLLWETTMVLREV